MEKTIKNLTRFGDQNMRQFKYGKNDVRLQTRIALGPLAKHTPTNFPSLLRWQIFCKCLLLAKAITNPIHHSSYSLHAILFDAAVAQNSILTIGFYFNLLGNFLGTKKPHRNRNIKHIYRISSGQTKQTINCQSS